jgi:TadE-like protein
MNHLHLQEQGASMKIAWQSPNPIGVCRRPNARLARRRSERGQSFLEFSLILPVLFLLVLGVSIIAQGFNLQMVLYGAAYEGARIWSKNPAGADNIHCTPPACDPNEGTARNFEKYVMPSVRQYLTTNGFDGSNAFFFAKDREKANDALELVGNNPQLVRVTVLYPIKLPVGEFASGFQEVLISASCTLKRGA